MNKIVKIAATITAVSLLGFYSCQKINDNKNEIAKYIPLAGKTITFFNLNDEAKRVAEELEEAVYNLTVNASASFGKYPQDLDRVVIFGGYTPNNLQLQVNDYTYSASENGGWYRPGEEFKTFFDNTLSVQISNGVSSNQFTFHAPKLIAFKKLGQGNSLEIGKEGNLLEWNTDPNNTTGQVVLSVKCYDNEELGEHKGLIYSDIFVIDDKGSYDISHITSQNGIKRIEIELGRGNGGSFVDEVNGNTFFNVKSSDYHEYLIRQ